jgi:hypothetical protein
MIIGRYHAQRFGPEAAQERSVETSTEFTLPFDRFGRRLKYHSNQPIDSVIAEEALRDPAGPSQSP